LLLESQRPHLHRNQTLTSYATDHGSRYYVTYGESVSQLG
jgi:hypothetical protein